VKEDALNPAGFAYEINPDTHGNLWITDYGANQVRQVHPATGAVTIYSGLANASDARMDPGGMVWWTNGGNTDLGRIAPGTSTLTTWKLPGTGALGGVAFDGAGRVWTTDVLFNGMIYRFTPGTGEVCTYAIPDGGAGAYIQAQGADIWLGDTANNRILKLDSGSAVFTLWQLEGGAIPKGLALEAGGNLWWADESQPLLARLEPGISRMTAYALPAGTQPEMIALSQGKVWYTQNVSGMVGVLDPAKASGTSSTLVKTTAPVTPGCSNLGAGTNSTIATSTAALAWTANVYNLIVDSGGWTVYQMPAGGHPWGIAAAQSAVWVVDQSRQKLAWLPQGTHVYLPLVIR
jgi:streptogramin lyase